MQKTSHDFSQFTPTYERLPYWARSTNPIVRRHLGLYWRTIPPELQPFIRITLLWLGLLLLDVVLPLELPLVFVPAIAFSVGALIALPIALYYYGMLLARIGAMATLAMTQEMRNNTMPLLIATPMSLEQIFLGKIAAAIWKQMDTLVLIAYIAILICPSLLIIHYDSAHAMRDGVMVARGLTGLTLVASLLRLLVEPVMVGAIGVLVGSVVRYRSTAVTSTLLLAGGYFVLLNMLRYLPNMTSTGTLLVDVVLPLLLPPLITLFCLRVTRWIVMRD